MALNSEPADPIERRERKLPPKSYAHAAEEALTTKPSVYAIDFAAAEALSSEDNEIDEDLIKESPPRHRPGSLRPSSPRSLGEVIEESEGPPPGSPSLRHPRGRLEKMEERGETYADAVKHYPPPQERPVTPVTNGAHRVNGTSNGEISEVKRSVNGHGHKSQDVEHEDDATSHADDRVNGISSKSEKSQPEKSQADKSQSEKSQSEKSQSEKSQPENEPPNHPFPERDAQMDGLTDEKSAQPGQLVYENLRSKSGENLASIRPDNSFFIGLQQREDNLPGSVGDTKSQMTPQRQSGELVSGRRAGAGWGRSAIRFAPLNVPIQRRLQMAMVLLHSLSIVGLLAFFFLLCTIPLLWPILVPYLLYLLLSRAHVDGELRHQSKWMRQSKVWSLFAGYFPARLHRSEVLEPTRKYIFGYHPHGIISHGAYAAFATDALGFSQLFPGISNTLLTLDSNFRVPLYRDFALRMGLASVSRESCENILSKGGPNGEGMGRAITIVVGGARESLDAKPGTLRLVLRRRKGFVKLAIRTGADLVPVLSFGENDLYDQFDATSHPYVHKAQMLVKKFMGFTVPLFHARGVFNYDVGMMPYRRPVNIVVGRPIRILQSKTPDPAYVDEIHAQYVKELTRLWNDWHETFARGMKEKLEIIE